MRTRTSIIIRTSIMSTISTNNISSINSFSTSITSILLQFLGNIRVTLLPLMAWTRPRWDSKHRVPHFVWFAHAARSNAFFAALILSSFFYCFFLSPTRCSLTRFPSMSCFLFPSSSTPIFCFFLL